jgi:hypothetical protein
MRCQGKWAGSALHHLEEFLVALGRADLVEQELHRGDFVHVVQQLAQDPDLLEHVGLDQQFLAAGARARDVDGRIDALFHHPAIQVQLRIAGALELFEDHLVHPAAGVDQGGGDDGERAALFDVAGGAEEALGPLQRIGVDTAGQHLAGCRDHGVVGARQAGDGVQQDDHVALVLDQPLGFFDHHLGHLDVPGGRLVEGRGDDFATHRPAHFRHLLGPLVDQQHDQGDIRVIGGDGMRNVLHQHRLAGLGRRDDQAALAFADRRDHVDDPAGDVFFGADVALQRHHPVGMQRREVLEQDLVLARLGGLAIDLVDLDQREVAFPVFGCAHLAFDGVARVQVEPADLGRRNVDVVGARQVGRLGRAQEPETVGQHFQHPVTEDRLAGLGLFLEDREHQFLLAQALGRFDLQAGGHLDQERDVLSLQFG